jgi:uncharacterized membrane protein
MKLYRLFFDEIKKSPIIGSIAIVSFLSIIVLFFTYNFDSNFIESSTLTILFMTLIVLIWYTIETRKMAKIQHQDFLERRKPLISFNLSNNNPDKYSITFQLINHKPLFTTTIVHAKLTVDDKVIEISDHYNGNSPWQVQPSSAITAPFSQGKKSYIISS